MQGVRGDRQRLPLLGLLAANLQGLLHVLPVPHVDQLGVLPDAVLPDGLLHVAVDVLLRAPGLGLSPGRSPRLPHSRASVWKNPENFNPPTFERLKRGIEYISHNP